MKRLIAIALFSTIQAFCWNPLTPLKNVVTGKYGWVISVAAFGVAEGCDYRTTIVDIHSGVGVEANGLLTNSQGQFIQSRLIAVKLFSFVEPVGTETWLYQKMNIVQRQKYGKWVIIGNWVATGIVGGVAAHNKEIYIHTH